MDVFDIGAEELDPSEIRFDAFRQAVESGERQLNLVCGENPNWLEGFCPSTVYGDFIGQQSLVEREGALEGVEVRVWRGFEAASPQAIVFASGGGHLRSMWSAAA